jgi:hypothetical protein
MKSCFSVQTCLGLPDKSALWLNFNALALHTRRTGMLDIDTTGERIESKGGLILAGKAAEVMRLAGIISPVTKKCGKVITRLFGALVQGESDFEAVRPFRESELIQQSFGLDTAFSAETVRHIHGQNDRNTGTGRRVGGTATGTLKPAAFKSSLYAGEDKAESIHTLRHRYQPDEQ